MSPSLTLPEPLGRGRPSKEDRRRYDRQLAEFASQLKRIRETELQGPIGKRSWCYYLESEGVVDKGQFGDVEELLDKARRKGFLPVTFLADDDACGFSGHLERQEPVDPVEFAKERASEAVRSLRGAGSGYLIGTDELWHHYARVHPWMLVEKTDLKTEVFGPVCAEYGIPIANARGQVNITTRGKLRERFKEADEAGCVPVLLYAGDHDPDGLQMADEAAWKRKFRDLRDDDWIDRLRVIHVAITADFIGEHGIDWIDNLKSSTGRERQASDGEFVAEYLETYGRRKVEANSLVVPEYREAARAEFRETLEGLLGDARGRKKRDEEERRETAKEAVEGVPVDEIEAMVEEAIGR